MQKKIGVLALALLITGSIDSIRNMPATAMFGPQLIFFAVMGAIFFLIPVGLVAAELATKKGLEGGIYSWVKNALGARVGFLAVWLQWINTMVWYPTILSFIAGTAAYLINPHLAEHKVYIVAVILTVFWALTLMNLKGIRTAATVASVCAVFGMVIPILLIIALGLVWLFKGLPLQLQFSTSALFPHLHHAESWISLTAIITSFLGMELAAVHIKDVEKPNRNFPAALLFAVFFILGTMIFGSLVIAMVLPQKTINLVAGTMQVFDSFFHAYHLTWALPMLAVMLVVGSIGGMINWVISPARGLLQAAKDDFLPKPLRKKNKHNVAHNMLLLQAILVTFMCLAFVLMPGVNGSYWLLTDLSTELYVVMYMLMFVAAIVLKIKGLYAEEGFVITRNKMGTLIVCALGLVGCFTTFVVGFFPPANIDVGSNFHYFSIFTLSLLVMLLPVFGFFWYKKKLNKLVLA